MRDRSFGRLTIYMSGLTAIGIASAMLLPGLVARHVVADRGAARLAMVLPIHRRYAYHCHRRRGYRKWCHQGARRWFRKTPEWRRRRREERAVPAWPRPQLVAPDRYRSI